MIYDYLVQLIGEPIQGSEFVLYLCGCAVFLFCWDTVMSLLVIIFRMGRN